MRETVGRVAFDLRRHSVRDLNHFLHGDLREVREVVVENPDGRREFQFQRGPIFAHLILADEINRATPKTQSALLEAMQEKQVTAAGEIRKLADRYMYVPMIGILIVLTWSMAEAPSKNTRVPKARSPGPSSVLTSWLNASTSLEPNSANAATASDGLASMLSMNLPILSPAWKA